MKKSNFTKLIVITVITGIFSANAQSSLCTDDLSIFVESAKVKNYDTAYQPWKVVYDSCPKLNYATYAYGDRILMQKIKKASSKSEKEKMVNLFIEMYQVGNKYFPKKIPYAKVSVEKAMALHDNQMADKEEVYNILKDGFSKDKANFHDLKAMYLYFSLLVDLHKEGKKELQEVFDTYDDVMEKLDEEDQELSKKSQSLASKQEKGTISKKEKKRLIIYGKIAEANHKIISSIDSKLGALADCKNLIPLYTKNFENKKNDAVWLKRAAGRMNTKDCSGDPLFVKLVDALHKLDPSPESAYYLGVLNERQKNTSQAVKYYQEAVKLQKDTYKKSGILLKIAHSYSKKGKRSTAYSYAKKALSYTPNYGEAYLLISSIYADSANECGNTTFEKRAIYWKAAEAAAKAARLNPSLRSRAKKIENSYSKRAPSKSDVFESGMEGKVIQIKCWIGGTITVPKL